MGFMLERERTSNAPYILIDEDKGYMRFEGECYLENIHEYFKDVCQWLDGYLASDFTELTFDCALEYFNSSTTKLLYNILRIMDEAAGKRKVVVNWIAAPGDEMIVDFGEDFRVDMENLEFNMVEESKQ